MAFSLPRLVAYLFASMFVGFGINAMVRIEHGLSLLELSPPITPADRNTVDALMMIYGVRDIFMGLALFAAALFGTRKTLGWTLIAAGSVAFVDGAVCKMYSSGEWSHWSYAPVVALTGVSFLT